MGEFKRIGLLPNIFLDLFCWLFVSHIITQLATYTWYISVIYGQLVDEKYHRSHLLREPEPASLTLSLPPKSSPHRNLTSQTAAALTFFRPWRRCSKAQLITTWRWGCGGKDVQQLHLQNRAGLVCIFQGTFLPMWTRWWFQKKYFHPRMGNWSNLTNIFQTGWNHQLVDFHCFFYISDLFRKTNNETRVSWSKEHVLFLVLDLGVISPYSLRGLVCTVKHDETCWVPHQRIALNKRRGGQLVA